MKSKIFAYAVLPLVCLFLGLQTSIAKAQTPAKAPQKVFVQLGQGTNNLHAALMAFKLSEAMQKSGAKVTLFLNLEAVRFADKRQPSDLSWGQSGGHSLQQLYDQFVEKGGAILVCPMCAKATGLDDKNLKKGSKFASSGEEIANAILDADKTLSY